MPPSRPSARALVLALALAASAPAASAEGPPAPDPGAPTAAVPVVPVAPAAAHAPERPFFEKHLPPALRAKGPRGLLWWQWLAIPALVVVALAVGSALGFLTRRLLGHLVSRTRTRWDDVLLLRVAGPLTSLWAVAVFTASLPWLVLPPGAASVVEHLLRAAVYLAVFWAAVRSVNVAFALAAESPWAKRSPSLAGFLPVGRKIVKVLVVAIGLVAVLNELGFKVASLLAGVGIGGIALALAAQKTVENVFGSVSIGVDQPFRVGDFVKIEDAVLGTIETIGFRSTRIRTLDRTIVTIPNGKLADMRAETFAVRDRFRLLANLGLAYSTTEAQMREVLAGLERVLRDEPTVWPDAVIVRFSAFTDSALNVEVAAWFVTADWNAFTLVRQELFMKFMAVVERAGTSFAYPTRTVHLVQEEARGADGGGRRG
jgi:MscS family membrane protein